MLSRSAREQWALHPFYTSRSEKSPIIAATDTARTRVLRIQRSRACHIEEDCLHHQCLSKAVPAPIRTINHDYQVQYRTYTQNQASKLLFVMCLSVICCVRCRARSSSCRVPPQNGEDDSRFGELAGAWVFPLHRAWLSLHLGQRSEHILCLNVAEYMCCVPRKVVSKASCAEPWAVLHRLMDGDSHSYR